MGSREIEQNCLFQNFGQRPFKVFWILEAIFYVVLIIYFLNCGL